jgi:nicotinate-nucleotide--dimethylbenzimidazole phosphoribosyltransferase
LVDSLGARPVLDLDMRLGEGTGCATVMHLIEDGLAIWHDMVTWEQAGVKRCQ